MNAIKKERILAVVNPVAGNRDKSGMVDRIRQVLSGKGELKVFETKGKGDRERLKALARDYEPERVLAIGGDGTVKLIVEAMGDQPYTMGVLPAGSANGLATDLELPEDFDEALEVALGDRVMYLDVLQLNDTLGLHISDMGINAELIRKYSESSGHGYLTYLKESVPTLIETEMPYEFTLVTDGEERHLTACMVAFANSRKFGTGASINPKGEMDDGVFEVVVIKDLKFGAVLQTLLGDMPQDPEFVEIFPAREAVLSTPSNVSFQIDGEHQGEIREVRVSILPRKVTVAIGQRD